MQKLKMHSPDMTQANIAHIRTRFPHCVTEAHDANGNVVYKADFDLLRQELAGEIVEGPQERYRLDWPGKRQAMLTANAPITKSLRPCREESVDFDTTENLYIEGDNLEVLKLLQESYLGKIKMVYIDPPYNTGNDFIYNDNFVNDSKEFLQLDGQYDDNSGDRMVQNLESNGRFHSDWLNMIYQRLYIARNLLSDDGVIFISIDDSEILHLRKLCNDIFGADNFRNTLLIRRRIKSLNSQFSTNGLQSLNVGFEYILVYSKSTNFTMKPLRMKKLNIPERGRWDVFWSNADRPTMRYEVLGFTPASGQWRYSQDKAVVAIENYQEYQKNFSTKMTLEVRCAPRQDQKSTI